MFYITQKKEKKKNLENSGIKTSLNNNRVQPLHFVDVETDLESKNDLQSLHSVVITLFLFADVVQQPLLEEIQS